MIAPKSGHSWYGIVPGPHEVGLQVHGGTDEFCSRSLARAAHDRYRWSSVAVFGGERGHSVRLPREHFGEPARHLRCPSSNRTWPTAAETPCVTDTAGRQLGLGRRVPPRPDPRRPTHTPTTSADQTTGPVAPGATALVSLMAARSPAAVPRSSCPARPRPRPHTRASTAPPSPREARRLSGATINGQTISPASPGAEQTTQLGGGSYVTLNQQLQTPLR